MGDTDDHLPEIVRLLVGLLTAFFDEDSDAFRGLMKGEVPAALQNGPDFIAATLALTGSLVDDVASATGESRQEVLQRMARLSLQYEQLSDEDDPAG